MFDTGLLDAGWLRGVGRALVACHKENPGMR